MTIQELIAECKNQVDAVDKRMSAHMYLDLVTAIKAKYLDLLEDQISSKPRVYFLMGSNYSEPHVQPILLASFSFEELDEAKRDYYDKFTTLIIESCSFV